MRYFCVDMEHADADLLAKCAFSIRGMGAILSADSVADVLMMNEFLARKAGRKAELTEDEVVEAPRQAIDNILNSIKKINRR